MTDSPAHGPVSEATSLAVVRTKVALDRTLLAWIRTSFALAGFGFSLAAYVSHWIESGAVHGVSPYAPRNLGVTLVALGILGLLGGTIEHRAGVRRLRGIRDDASWSAAFPLAALLLVVSVLMFVAVLVKAGPFAH